MSTVSPDIVKRVFGGGHFVKFKMVASFLATPHLKQFHSISWLRKCMFGHQDRHCSSLIT